ncbi:MAG: hypothetical protein JO186_10235 [Actinobacteria bacterium]|nr:hypothetical protein [Actinomycetota bacterium]MBV8396654.1 hypothetical protein [Actinomycetota bacterium]
MDWAAVVDRERARYEDGERRNDPAQLVRMGNAAYGAGLASLMAGHDEEAREWLGRAAARWQESFAPEAWGRPIGALKALLIAGHDEGAVEAAHWTLELGTATAESPIGRYAAALALLTLERWPEARHVVASLRERDDFPHDVADALALIAAHDVVGYTEAVESVLASFEARDAYLEDVPVADTVLALQALARRRGFAAELQSALLPWT